MAGTNSALLQLFLDEHGIHLVLDNSPPRVGRTLSLAEAAEFWLKLGSLMHQGAVNKERVDMLPGQRAAINVGPTGVVVSRLDGHLVMRFDFSDFPSIRLHIPDEGIDDIRRPLNEMAATPADIKDGPLQ